MLLAFLALRVPELVGEVFYLEHVTPQNVSHLVDDEKVSILLLTDNLTDFSFCNLAVSMYGNMLHFAVGDAEVAKYLALDAFPCYAAYHKGRLLGTSDIRDASEFAAFSQHMFNKLTNTTVLFNAEQFRRVLAGNETVLVGIDSKEPPAGFKHDIPFYGVQGHVTRQFGLPTSAGYYVYRPVDRQFIRTSRNYKQYLTTPIVPFGSVDFNKREFVVALFVSLREENTSVAGREVDMLHQAARKYGNKAFFSIVCEEQPFEAEFGLKYIERPYVLVWKGKIDSHRWIWKGEGDLEAFVGGVLAGETQQAPLVKADPEANECTLHDFERRTATGDVFLLVYSEGNDELGMRKEVVASVRELLPAVTFLEFDAGRNEWPKNLNLSGDLPIIAVLKNGIVEHQFEYRRDTTVRNLVDIVIEHSTQTLEKPELDYDDLQRNISRKFPASFDIPTFDFNMM